MVYGRAGVGKSTLLSSFPETMMLSTERISRGLTCFDFNWEAGGVTSWAVFKKALDLLERDGERGGFRTVAVDTIDAAYNHCLTWVCQQKGITHPSDLEYGKGWNLLRTEFRETLLRVPRMGLGLTMTSHCKESTITSPSGSKVSRIEPSCSGQAYDIIKSISDVTIYIDWMKNLATGKNIRVMITDGDEVLDAKNNCGLPRYLGFGKGDGYAQIKAAMKGEDVGIADSKLIPSELAGKATQDLARSVRSRPSANSRKKKTTAPRRK